MACLGSSYLLEKHSRPLPVLTKSPKLGAGHTQGQGYCSSPEYGDANNQTVELNFLSIGKELCIERYYLIL